MLRVFALTIALTSLLAGCATRSISKSGYEAINAGCFGGNPFYRGELTEYDVIGEIAPEKITEQDVTSAFGQWRQNIRLPRGSQLMVIQSGSITPDDAFLTPLQQYYSAAPFSGLPPEKKENFNRQLRITAARGGIQTVLCYWGVLETAQINKAGKALSWIPIAGYAVPDKNQIMRIRLKAVLLDVPSGRWTMLTPSPVTDERLSAKINRAQSDQKQVELLKTKGYQSLIDLILAKYS